MKLEYRSPFTRRRVRLLYNSQSDMWAHAWRVYRVARGVAFARLAGSSILHAASDPWAVMEEVTRP